MFRKWHDCLSASLASALIDIAFCLSCSLLRVIRPTRTRINYRHTAVCLWVKIKSTCEYSAPTLAQTQLIYIYIYTLKLSLVHFFTLVNTDENLCMFTTLRDLHCEFMHCLTWRRKRFRIHFFPAFIRSQSSFSRVTRDCQKEDRVVGGISESRDLLNVESTPARNSTTHNLDVKNERFSLRSLPSQNHFPTTKRSPFYCYFSCSRFDYGRFAAV